MSAWNWSAFRGSELALSYNRRDLPALNRAISYTKQQRVAVQAGGHLGIFPKRLAEVFDTVYTFEPSPDLFAALVHNAPEENIVKLQAALGQSHEFVGLSRERRDGSNRPTHEGLTHVAGAGRYPTIRLDDLALPVCDLLVLDVEGWEVPAILGAIDTIHQCRPVIAVEINKNQAFVNRDPDEVKAQVLGFNYRLAERLESDWVYVPQEWTVARTA